jgi:hypothetical protein
MQIIDGFTVNTAKPIDDRLVTSGTASRNAIVYKYNGLRVYDTDSKQPYVWDGSMWTSESSSSVTISGTTTIGNIPVFANNTQIANSLISQVTSGTNTKFVYIANGGDTAKSLKVDGMVEADSFRGSGNKLENIPGSALSGNIDVNKISPVSNPVIDKVYILKSGTATAEWTDLSTIPSSAIPASALNLQNTSSTPLYVSFGATSGKSNYYNSTSGDAFRFIPRVNGTSEGAQLQIPSGSEANPSVAFSTNGNTGIYKAGFNILGISVGGTEKMRLTEKGVVIKSNFTTESQLKIQNPGGRPFVALYGLNGDSLMSGTIGFSGIWNGMPSQNTDLIIENFAGDAAVSYQQIDAHFDENSPSITDGRRHMINMNGSGQTIVATNVGSFIDKFENGIQTSGESKFYPNGAYGCHIYNSNPSMGHGLQVKSGGGPNTIVAKFDNGSKSIASFTDRGLEILRGAANAASISFESDGGTGLYSEGPGKLNIVANGRKILTISDSGIKLPKEAGLAYIFGDDTRIEGTNRTNSLEIYRPTTNAGNAICHFYSNIGGVKSAKAYIWPDGSYYRLSDRRQKENIKTLEYGLDEILRLNPVTHTWLYSDATRPSIGLIAQEVEEVLGELVNTSMDGENEIKALDYNGLIPVLIKSIQELNKKIEILEAR